MRSSPYLMIIGSAIVAILIIGVYLYQTSPRVTDAPQVATDSESSVASDSDSDSTNQIENPNANNEDGVTLARVHPDGRTVIAGQAPPHSTIQILKDGEVIGTTKAAASGEWVVSLDEELSQTAHLLAVKIIALDGAEKVADMALAIEIPSDSDETPLVALVPYTAESSGQARILQAPVDLSINVGQLGSVHLVIRFVQALNDREISINGSAAGGEVAVFTVNGQGGVKASPDAEGLYSAVLVTDPDDEVFRIKGVLQDDNGQQKASVQLSVNRAQFDGELGKNRLIVIQKGDALWRIAYRTYGDGFRYVDIYRQNKSQINDPDLIYPNQIFSIPDLRDN